MDEVSGRRISGIFFLSFDLGYGVWWWYSIGICILLPSRTVG
jgi:hypothetical protein